ncbi:MAG: fumarate hydratase [Candidatus Saganbacteria bacterium]|nr:fumarate hydratase [Candidatus Saganbacteria bacterium]
MREIEAKIITDTVKELCIDANINLSDDVLEALNEALKIEESENGREMLRQILRNAEIARQEKLPICQDTGVTVVFVELGQQVLVVSGNLRAAINEGVSLGYEEGNLRKSIVSDPFRRKNTGDNTPAIIHTEIVPGDKIKIILMAKGAGSENVSAAKVLTPAEGIEGIQKFVVETVTKAGANPCPPIIVGVGVGGNLEYSCLLAKKALLRKIGKRNSQSDIAKIEKQLHEEINATGIGPGGLGGRVTALAVNIETYPCHMASLPVCVNIDCHVHRVKETVI